MRTVIRSVIGLFFLLSVTPIASAEQFYYMSVFSAQRPVINRPMYSHTFAAFVKQTVCNGKSSLESFTISWLPRGRLVQPLALLPEEGRNYGLHETLQFAACEKTRVSMWGPYQIQPLLYCRALKQRGQLESGEVLYKAVDTPWPAARVSNCIHAVSDLAEDSPPLRIASSGWGDPASYYVTLHLSPWIIDYRRTYEWVYDVLGLRSYCIVRRDLSEGNPAGVGVSAFMSVTQIRLQRQARCLRSQP
jgi:hypothetical protein